MNGNLIIRLNSVHTAFNLAQVHILTFSRKFQTLCAEDFEHSGVITHSYCWIFLVLFVLYNLLSNQVSTAGKSLEFLLLVINLLLLDFTIVTAVFCLCCLLLFRIHQFTYFQNKKLSDCKFWLITLKPTYTQCLTMVKSFAIHQALGHLTNEYWTNNICGKDRTKKIIRSPNLMWKWQSAIINRWQNWWVRPTISKFFIWISEQLHSGWEYVVKKH